MGQGASVELGGDGEAEPGLVEGDCRLEPGVEGVVCEVGGWAGQVAEPGEVALQVADAGEVGPAFRVEEALEGAPRVTSVAGRKRGPVGPIGLVRRERSGGGRGRAGKEEREEEEKRRVRRGHGIGKKHWG